MNLFLKKFSWLTIFWVLIPQVCSHGLGELIAQLNKRLEARLNVYHGIKAGSPLERILMEQQFPRLILNEQANFELRKHFDTDILTIVLISKEFSKFSSFEKTSKIILKRLNRKDILFILDTSIIEPDNVKWLFDWCWKKGFMNVLLTDFKQTLLTFEPFPAPKIINTTVASYLEKRNNWTNLQGYRIRAAAGNNPPRALIYKDKNGVMQYNGLFPHIVNIFATHYNAGLEYILMPNYQVYTVLDCVKYLTSRQVDLCADGIFMDEAYVTTDPLYIYHGFLMVRCAQPIHKFRYFLVPFNAGVWLLIGVSIVYTTLALALIYWRQHGVLHLGKFFLDALGSFLYLSVDLLWIYGKAKYLLIPILLLTGFIFSNYYAAFLSSILTTNIYEKQVETLEDLREQNITVLVSDLDLYIFRTYGVSEQLWEPGRMIEMNHSTYRSYRDFLNTRFAYINLMDKAEFFMSQQKFMRHPRMKVLKEPVDTVWGGIPLVEEWPFTDLLNKVLQRCFESGVFKHIFEVTKEEAIRAGQIRLFQTDYYQAEPLSVAYFEMPAFLLAFGFMVGLVTFVMELLLGGMLWKIMY